MNDRLLDVDQLVVEYPGRGFRAKPFRALHGVSLDILPRETVGLVGESGSGKTTLGRAVLGLAPVTGGTIGFGGRDISHLARSERRALSSDIGVVFQDPYTSLNPAMTIQQILTEPLTVTNVSKAEATLRVKELLDQVQLPSNAGGRLPREFSGGQRQRVAIARALALSPKLIVCDEPVSALDLSTQARVLALFLEIQERTGVAYLFISHDLDVVRHLSHRVAVMYQGEIVESGDGAQVTGDPQHPYTKRLFLASPVADPERQAQRRAERHQFLQHRPAPVSDDRPAVRFGAAYYAEYQRTPRLKTDFDLMAEAGFTVIRVGESVWSTWEPEDGVFDLDWLEPVLDEAHARGIGVILGTPTYAIPMWLKRRYPEIAGDSATGQPIGWGARQEVDFTHAAYLFHAERVIRAVVTRYRDHPAIIGYQVDNEPGLRLLYNESIFQRFVDWLRRRYGTVERLNEEWGLVYWSHRLSTWADLWRPDGNYQPQYDLAWRRFQTELVTEFIGWQADLVRDIVGDIVGELVDDSTFVTTCISYEQPGIEDVDLSARLDIASGNAYYEMEDSLSHPNDLPMAAGPMGWVVRGPWAVSHLADLMYSSRQAPFLVTETNAGSIGFSSMNQSPYDGQWRQAAWLLVARGARMISYWHWNTLAYGAETYWGGVLPHSGEPGRVYRELAGLGAELRRAGEAFASADPDFDIAVLYDSDSKFALTTQAPFSTPGQFFDPDAYRRIVGAFTRGVFDAKRQQRLVRPQQLLPSRGGELSPQQAAERYPVLVVAALYTAGDEDLDFLAAYAESGGHLVLGPRSAYADREGRPREERQPAGLGKPAGVGYDELATLPDPVPVSGEPLAGAATLVAELLEPDGAEVLARYVHPHLGRWAAVTTKASGAGRITVVGTVPDQPLAESLARWLAPEPAGGWQLPASVTVSTSATPADSGARRLHVLHNWGWETQTVSAPAPLHDLLTDEELAPGTTLELGAWDVRVFTQNL